jgi:hypothetical protein
MEVHEEGGPGSHRRGDSSGSAAMAGSGPAAARAGGARVHTVAGSIGSLMIEARLAVGGRGGERRGAHVGQPGKEMEWAELGENAKWAGPR